LALAGFVKAWAMFAFLRSMPVRLGRAARRRPRIAVLTVVVTLLGAASAFYGYAVWEWREAVTAVREGHPASAQRKLGVCLTVWPSDPSVHRLAARAARINGDLAAAEDHLNICLRLEHGASEETQLEFLLMRAQSGEVDEVGSLLFNYVNRGHPDAPMILEAIATAYMHNLRYGAAYFYLNQWIKLFPDTARPYHFRGWVLERMNQSSMAVEDYLHALELDSNLDLVRLRVAEMFLEDKEPLKALPHLEVLIRRDPSRPEPQARLGECRYLQGRHAEARQLLESVADRLPNDPLVLLYLARLDIDSGQAVRAEERLRKSLALEPSDVEARFTLVTALRMQGRDADSTAELTEYSRQKTALERANLLLQNEAKMASRDPQAAFEIGTLLLQLRRDAQGLHWLHEALLRDPAHQPTHQALAEYFESRGDLDQAATHRKFLERSRGGP
jgi:tetratricopeptide (TPR) repeat protein